MVVVFCRDFKDGSSSPATALACGSSDQDRLDRYRLVLGLAVKSLCSSVSDQPKNSQGMSVKVCSLHSVHCCCVERELGV